MEFMPSADRNRLEEAKREIRRGLLARRRATPGWLRRLRSRSITQRLAGVSAWARARTIFAYSAVGAEADPSPLLRAALQAGRSVAFPRVLPGGRLEFNRVGSLAELAPGALGIPEPPAGRGTNVSPGAGDLVLVPGVAFALDGVRLGRGGGHYDRALARRRGAVALGLGFEGQLLPALPWGDRDVRLEALVTESRTLFFGTAPGHSLRSSAIVPPTKN
jgi:5-formyltetrahydrofolate cyclo-ligase